MLHSNAEFTYGIHAQRYDVSYPCARSDFARLLDQGFLRQHDDGIRHFFVASDEFEDVFATYVRERCAKPFTDTTVRTGRCATNAKARTTLLLSITGAWDSMKSPCWTRPISSITTSAHAYRRL